MGSNVRYSKTRSLAQQIAHHVSRIRRASPIRNITFHINAMRLIGATLIRCIIDKLIINERPVRESVSVVGIILGT